jgi:hypothetical protein
LVAIAAVTHHGVRKFEGPYDRGEEQTQRGSQQKEVSANNE